MKIKIKTFASLKDILGFSEKTVDLPENISVSQAVTELKNVHPDFMAYGGLLLIAKNEEFCSGNELLKDGDVMALFPPVSGG